MIAIPILWNLQYIDKEKSVPPYMYSLDWTAGLTYDLKKNVMPPGFASKNP